MEFIQHGRAANTTSSTMSKELHDKNTVMTSESQLRDRQQKRNKTSYMQTGDKESGYCINQLSYHCFQSGTRSACYSCTHEVEILQGILLGVSSSAIALMENLLSLFFDKPQMIP